MLMLPTRPKLQSPRPWDLTQSRDMSGRVHVLLNLDAVTVVAYMYVVGVGG